MALLIAHRGASAEASENTLASWLHMHINSFISKATISCPRRQTPKARCDSTEERSP
jgi:hypothetical protein